MKPQIVITINPNDDAEIAFISKDFSNDDAEQIGTMIALLNCGMYHNVFLKAIQSLFTLEEYREFCDTMFNIWKAEEDEIQKTLFSLDGQSNNNEEEEPMVRPDDLPYAPPLPGVND